MILLPLASFLGFCLAYPLLFQRSIEESPFYVVSGLILSLYLAAYLGVLGFFSTALLFLGLIALLFSTCFFLFRRDYAAYLSPTFLTWCALFGILSIIVYTRQYYAWDEFMHWGPLAKLVNINNGFVSSVDVVHHKSYPPAAPLFYYFFYSFGGYSEGATYVAHLSLMTSPWMIALKKYSWNQSREAVFAYLGCVVVFIAVYPGTLLDISRIYLDVPVATFFGAMLVLYYHSRKATSDILFLIPPACAFVLLKPQLFPFIILLAVVIFSTLLIRKRLSFSALLSVILLVFTVFVFDLSWKMYLSSIGVDPRWGLSSILQYLNEGIEWSRAKAFFGQMQFQFVIVGVLSMVAYVLGLCLESKKKKEWAAVCTMLGLGFLAYIGFLFTFYMFSTIEYNAILVHSFTHFQSVVRYTAIYLLAMAFFLYRFSLDYLNSFLVKAIRNSVIFLSSVIVILLCFSSIFTFNELYNAGDTILQQRPALSALANKVKQYTLSTDKVFTVWEAATPIQYYILLYELTPRRYVLGPFKFGDHSACDAVFYLNYDPEELAVFLAQFDAVFLANTNSEFWTQYSSVFEGLPEYPLMQYGMNGAQHNAYLYKVNGEGAGVSFKNVIEGNL